MTKQLTHKIYSPLRYSIIALWIFSLVGVGASPLYYVSTSKAESTASSNSVTSPEQSSSENNSRNSLSLRFTYNPFTTAATAAKQSEGAPLEHDGGLTHNAPNGSPVTLWLVSASANGTVSSSNTTRFIEQSDAADFQTRRPAAKTFASTALSSEHPSKLSELTLLGQKPSGVS